MLQKSPREEKLGCLFGIVGGFIGFFIGCRMHAADIAKILAADHNATIDFLPAFPFMGMFFGGLAGTLFGMVLSHLLPPKKPGKEV